MEGFLKNIYKLVNTKNLNYKNGLPIENENEGYKIHRVLLIAVN